MGKHSKRIVIAVAVAATAALAACSADATSFKETAEELSTDEYNAIAADEGLGVTVETSCEEPSSTEVGTTFSCTITASDGVSFVRTAEIQDGDVVQILPPSQEQADAADELVVDGVRATAEQLAVELAQDEYPDLTAEASCEEPASPEVGTTFPCTITFSDGDVLDVTGVVGENNQVSIEEG